MSQVMGSDTTSAKDPYLANLTKKGISIWDPDFVKLLGRVADPDPSVLVGSGSGF